MNTLQHFGLWDATNGDQGQVLAMVYRYDQLNRLRTARGVIGLGNTNTWNTVADAATNRYRSEYTYDANGNIETVQRYDGAGTGHYDSFAYHYHTSGGRKQQNRLYELIDAATMNTGSDIVTTATGFDNSPNGVNANNNYGYDALGNLVRDDREDIELIHWTVAGKVDSIQRPGTSSRSPLKFRYGASGQRVSKQVGDYYATEPGAYREHYIRDAQGNIMATYRYTNTGAASLKLNERPVYGSSRLGSLRTEVELHTLAAFDPASANPVQMVDLNYELTDHLGNVCAVVTGRLLDGNGGGTAKQAELVSAQGYEPFGSLLPERNYSSSSYNYGFQGQIKDDEINSSVGTSYAFEYRIHDPRIGRFLSIDPLSNRYPWNSPYAFSENRVIDMIELEGAETKETGTASTITRTNPAISQADAEFAKKVLDKASSQAAKSSVRTGAWQTIKRVGTFLGKGPVIAVEFFLISTPAGNGSYRQPEPLREWYDPSSPGSSYLAAYPRATNHRRITNDPRELTDAECEEVIKRCETGEADVNDWRYSEEAYARRKARELIEGITNATDPSRYITFTQGYGEKAQRRTVVLPPGYRLVTGLSHDQNVYTNGKDFISPDRDGHNGGVWKKAKEIWRLWAKETRDGTYDENLNRIGD